MWISLFFTITIIVISYFTGLYFGTEYQKIIDRENNRFLNDLEFKNLETKHKNILESYFNQRWEDCLQDINSAKTLCNNLMEDYYNIMSLRINEFRENPLPKDWDGVYIATSK